MVYDGFFFPPPFSCLGILLVFTFVCLFGTCMGLIITAFTELNFPYLNAYYNLYS